MSIVLRAYEQISVIYAARFNVNLRKNSYQLSFYYSGISPGYTFNEIKRGTFHSSSFIYIQRLKFTRSFPSPTSSPRLMQFFPAAYHPGSEW